MNVFPPPAELATGIPGSAKISAFLSSADMDLCRLVSFWVCQDQFHEFPPLGPISSNIPILQVQRTYLPDSEGHHLCCVLFSLALFLTSCSISGLSSKHLPHVVFCNEILVILHSSVFLLFQYLKTFLSCLSYMGNSK